MKNVKCAVLVVGGWYDAEDLSGPYRTFNAINKFNPETTTTLVEGPWVHGGWRGATEATWVTCNSTPNQRIFPRTFSSLSLNII